MTSPENRACFRRTFALNSGNIDKAFGYSRQSLDRRFASSVTLSAPILGHSARQHSCNEAAESIRPDDFYLDAHRRSSPA